GRVGAAGGVDTRGQRLGTRGDRMRRRIISAIAVLAALGVAAGVLAACGAPVPTPATERERREALPLGTVEPNAGNTGVLPDVALSPASSEIVTLTTAGAVYENRDV